MNDYCTRDQLRKPCSFAIPEATPMTNDAIAQAFEEAGIPVAAYDYEPAHKTRRFVLLPRSGSGFLAGEKLPALQEDLSTIHRVFEALGVRSIEVV